MADVTRGLKALSDLLGMLSVTLEQKQRHVPTCERVQTMILEATSPEEVYKILKIIEALISSFPLEAKDPYTKSLFWPSIGIGSFEFLLDHMRGRRVLSVGSGNGLLEKMLRDCDVVIQATDSNPPPGAHRVKKYTAEEAILRFLPKKVDTLLISWPPNCNGPTKIPRCFAADPIEKKTFPVVIYIGEGPGGCTGSDAFHTALTTNYRLIASHEQSPAWSGIDEKIYIFQRIE